MAKKQAAAAQTAKREYKEEVHDIDLSRHAETSYLEYAMSVVKGRAIPYVEDGMKPVHRRILYAMSKLGVRAGDKHKKSARVVGDVIGKYHPHGDSAVYEAMVRAAQDFSLRYPLVDGQGNFGSRDGDPAAAMRYTEARMTKIAETLLSELDFETVDFSPTYDNTDKEPTRLPSRLPMILLNGASGIGVGIACEIPSHNLVETVDAAIHVIKHPKATLDEVMEILPAPDYPTGALIISSREEIKKAYAEGRGAVRARARVTVEGEGTKNMRLVVTELPYQVSAAKILQEVEGLLNPTAKEVKGKKIFTPEQLRLKTLFGGMIDRIRDESGKDAAVRIVVEPKSHKQDPAELIQGLLAYTSLEVNCPVNMVMVGLDKSPRQKGLLQALSEWCQFRVATVERRTIYEHKKASDRLHLLQGRLIVIDHIQEVIRIIQQAEDPKAALMERFGLSEIQATDVLEIRLRQLAKLERAKIVEEIAELEREIARLQKLLDSPAAMRAQVIKELEADKKTFGDARRSEIVESEKTARSAIAEKVTVTDDPITIAVSERGWIRAKAGHAHGVEAFPFKAGDSVRGLFRAKMSDYAIFLDEAGKSYSVPLHELPSAKGGEDVPIATLAEFGSKLAHAFVTSADSKWALASSSGHGFVCKGSDMITRLKAGKRLISLEEGARALPPQPVPAGAPAESLAFAALSSNRRLLIYRLAEINELSGGKGVALLGLDEGQSLLSTRVFAEPRVELVLEGAKKTIVLEGEALARHVQSRSASKKGKPVDAKDGAVDFVPFALDPQAAAAPGAAQA